MVAPIAIVVTVPIRVPVIIPLPLPCLMTLMLYPGLLPPIFLITLASVVVSAIVGRAELHTYGKLLRVRLRRSGQRKRTRQDTNRYALCNHRLYVSDGHNNLLRTSH